MWKRGNSIEEVSFPMSRRQLFSVCGKLLGHYPVAGWMRIATSYIKRHSSGVRWNDEIGEVAQWCMKDLLRRVELEDPVGGQWNAPLGANAATIWCDASNIALGTLLEIDGIAMEDAAWLRKKDDASHINVAELDSVTRGINLGIKWGMTCLNIITDSATVNGWMSSLLTDSHKIRSHGMGEMLIKRRLGMLNELRESYGLTITCTLVPSANNKADILTRVPKMWLEKQRNCQVACVAVVDDLVKRVHERTHFGIEKTLYFALKENPRVTRAEVTGVVNDCNVCKSIDPAPIKWEHGKLGVTENWFRLAS